MVYENPCVYNFETESTVNTASLPSICPMEFFDSREWVIMPDNVHGRIANMSGKDEESGISMILETGKGITMVVNDENKGGKCNAGEVEDASYMNNLNEGFRAMMPKIQAASHLSPCLVFSKNHDDTIYSVMDPMHNNDNYTMNLSDLADSTICFQKGGWLLITRKEKIFFYNPFTGQMVGLPDMDINRGDFYSAVSFSSLPTSSDCMVFIMDERFDKLRIKFIRRGEAHWSSRIFDKTYVERYTPFLNTVVFHNGDFFCANYKGTVEVFSTKDDSWKVLGKPHEQFDKYGYQGYLVECAGDLLLVQVTLNYRSKKSVRIFKLNFSEMEWVEVESLGEHMLFISQTSCVSAVAPNSNMKNNIYFPRLHVKGGDIVFYSLETGCYHSVGSEHSTKDLIDTEGWFRNCSWIEPNRLKSTSQELDWFKIINN